MKNKKDFLHRKTNLHLLKELLKFEEELIKLVRKHTRKLDKILQENDNNSDQ